MPVILTKAPVPLWKSGRTGALVKSPGMETHPRRAGAAPNGRSRREHASYLIT